ncbi:MULTISPECIES: Lrp/AsnC family transcriptional regulator [unclassified Aeromicrobium]|uniref:Lrp/AsnC family transcriptional regulator n=1 Tax=unclassified Aeromicrobium TaxID=2633570 RepID=UPI00396B43EC
MDLDGLDHAIIDNLRSDGRMSNVALADRVGLTPAPCLRRVQRLEAEGVIRGYQAIVSPDALGQGFEVFLDIDLTDFARGSIDAFETSMTGFAEVIELHRLFGTPDYHARIATADTAAYEAFLTDHVLTIPGISRVSSRFAMKTLKSLRPTGDTAKLGQ